MKQKRLSPAETAHICQSLALLVQGGVPLADGLWLLAREQEPFRQLLARMADAMDRGSPLSESLAASGVFPEPVHRTVYIGEQTGRLEEALVGLGEYYRQRHRTGRQLRAALQYPAATLVLMLGVLGVLLMQVLPIFDSVYASLGSSLTGIAGTLLQLGQLLRQAMPVLAAVLGLVLTAAVLLWAIPPVRSAAAGQASALLGDRGIFRKFNNARFAQGLAMGLASGMDYREAAELAALLLGHIPGAARRSGLCLQALEQGAALPEALAVGALLQERDCLLLQLSLHSGRGDTVMADIARRQLEQAEAALADALGKIEPALVLSASLLVGTVLLSVMLPLVNILSVLG